VGEGNLAELNAHAAGGQDGSRTSGRPSPPFAVLIGLVGGVLVVEMTLKIDDLAPESLNDLRSSIFNIPPPRRTIPLPRPLERVHEQPGAQLRLESSRGRSHALHRSARSVNLLISLERGIRLDRTRRTMWHLTLTPGLLVDCGQSCRALSPPPAPSSSSGRVPSSPSGR